MSDSLDFIVSGDDRESVPAFFRFLRRCPAKWALLWLGDFIADEETIGSVERAASEAGLKGRRLTPTRAPFLAVSGTWDAFLAGKSQHFRRILKQKESRLSRCDRRVAVERIRGPLGPEGLSNLRAVETGSWKGREFARSAEKKKEKEFLERALPALASRGWLDLWMARVDGRPAAYQINLDFGGKSWVYNNAFDRGSAGLSLGVALMRRAVEAAFREGKRECDFLRGEEAFKRAWTGTAKNVFQLVLRRPGIPSRLACAWAYGLVRNVRRFRSRYGKRLDDGA